MILNNSIIEDLKERSGLMFDKAGDFELLSSLIFKDTGRQIGVTTLKRLFFYISDDRKASSYTLNTIAIYIGFKTWNEYISAKNIESDWAFPDETLYIHALEAGTQITIKYLNREVTFSVIEIDGSNVLKVVAVENGSLKIGDLVYAHRIRKGDKFEAEKVIRGKNVGNYKTNGEIALIDVK